jgi:poly(3-hydroxybutyrate) depolymerase
MIGHGCGGTDAPFKLETVAKDQAIIVAMKSAESCFVYDMKVEGPYFDEVLKEVSNDTCVDTNRVFVAGFSSGSWLTNMLGCARSNVIRAQGNASGGLPSLPACQGPIPAFMVHDDKDTTNDIAGGQRARDRILKINSCSAETEPYDNDDDPKTVSTCVKYKGCTPGYPVVWCKTSGLGHAPYEPITTTGFWKFWSGF